MSFDLKGSKAMQKKIERIASSTVDRVGAALLIEGELIMTDSKMNYVPIDLGTLKSSGFVQIDRKGRDIELIMGYGGAAEEYAVAVHEHPSQYSPPSWQSAEQVTFSPEGRGPKYLEKPLMQAIPTLLPNIAKRLDLETI